MYSRFHQTIIRSFAALDRDALRVGSFCYNRLNMSVPYPRRSNSKKGAI
jgi:hypothetical protein